MNKTGYSIHIRKLKQALIHGIMLQKVHRKIKFNQKSWLKLSADMNTDLRKAAKMILKRNFSS